MEKLDQDLQKRVWQRVQSTGPKEMLTLGRENLKAWLLLARENAAAYRYLSRQMGSAHADQLHKLEQQTQRWTACAGGICRMRGEQIKFPPVKPPKETPRKLLEKCYHRERRLWEEAEQRGSDPEYGPVYRRLAAQAMERCVIVLELLGKLE